MVEGSPVGGRASCCAWRARLWAYISRKEHRDEPSRARMRELSAQYPRYGYRRVRIFLERQGWKMSPERTYRPWRRAGLQVPRRRSRRRIAASRPRPVPATGLNQVWAYDFVFDDCANGQQLKCLTIIDEWSRECLAIDVPGNIRSGRVLEVLSRLVSERGAPRCLRSDNGPEFVCGAVLKWRAQANIETAHIDLGKPWRNGADESFNGKFRDECLTLEWFRSRTEAVAVIEAWGPKRHLRTRSRRSLRRVATARKSLRISRSRKD